MEDFVTLFDFSDCPKHHPLYSDINKQTIDKFKDGLSGDTALKFVNLQSKMYSLKSHNEEQKRTKSMSTLVV